MKLLPQDANAIAGVIAMIVIFFTPAQWLIIAVGPICLSMVIVAAVLDVIFVRRS